MRLKTLMLSSACAVSLVTGLLAAPAGAAPVPSYDGTHTGARNSGR